MNEIAESLNLKSVVVDGHTLWWSKDMAGFYTGERHIIFGVIERNWPISFLDADCPEDIRTIAASVAEVWFLDQIRKNEKERMPRWAQRSIDMHKMADAWKRFRLGE